MGFLKNFSVLLLTVANLCNWDTQATGQGKALLKSYDQENSRGELALQVNHQAVAQWRWKGSAKDLEIGPFLWPADLHHITFQGNIDWVDAKNRKRQSVLSNTVPVVDITELTRPLRNRERTWSQCLEGYQASQEVFMEKQPELASEIDIPLDPGDRASRDQISNAEKRLGFALPTEHALTLQEFGCWGVDDSWTMQPEQLTNAFDQMLKVWETPAAALHALPEPTKKFLRSSVILFTIVGDGYGGIVYRPAEAGKTDSVPEYYEIQQDSITKPRLLKNHDGTRKSYSQAMLWLLAQEVLVRVESLRLNVCLVDQGAAGPLVYRITHETEGQNQAVRMTLDWEAFE